MTQPPPPITKEGGGGGGRGSSNYDYDTWDLKDTTETVSLEGNSFKLRT